MDAQPNLMFKAFADETRLRILHLLAHGEICVCDLVGVLKLPQPKISRHLGYLRRAGLVKDRKEGLWRYYILSMPEGKFHARIIGCLKDCFDEVRVLRADSVALSKLKKASKC